MFMLILELELVREHWMIDEDFGEAGVGVARE